MNILFLYNANQTFTNTVFEHVNAFSLHSRNRFFFCHHDPISPFNIDLSEFDAVILHYSVRLPFDQVTEEAAKALAYYQGLKVLFIQDEYDHMRRVWYWIKRLGFQLVFTVVPKENIVRVYPPLEFPGVRFISNLTGYVPEGLTPDKDILPPSSRDLWVGSRARPLPIRYGQLGQEKIGVGRLVRRYCETHGIRHSIAWTEEARIYGAQWYEFIASCRAMLGSESGSNVFDWDGTLADRIARFRLAHKFSSDKDVYREILAPLEIPGLMNQISPRVFEAIAFRTVLILFEGGYSGVVSAGLHFIPLKKDGSNLEEVFALLRDDAYVDKMTKRAYEDVIVSGKYSYKTFVKMVDDQMADVLLNLSQNSPPLSIQILLAGIENEPTSLTTRPIRATLVLKTCFIRRFAYLVWRKLPVRIREQLKPGLKALLRIDY